MRPTERHDVIVNAAAQLAYGRLVDSAPPRVRGAKWIS
jgi:hypothetical protein